MRETIWISEALHAPNCLLDEVIAWRNQNALINTLLRGGRGNSELKSL